MKHKCTMIFTGLTIVVLYFLSPRALDLLAQWQPELGEGGVHRRIAAIEKHGWSSADVELLFLGDSTVGASVDATRLTIPSINLAMGGADYEVMDLILDAALNQFPRVSVLVIQMDSLPMLIDNLGLEGSEVRAYCVDYIVASVLEHTGHDDLVAA